MQRQYDPRMLPLMAVLLSIMLVLPTPAKAAELMTKEELQNILANENTYVLDVRAGRDWNSSELKILGAHRADPESIASWASQFPQNGTLVLYCA